MYQYEFFDRWVLPGRPQQIFEALVDFDLYPRWGYPGYVSGRRNGPPEVGCTGTVVIQGGLPFKATLHCTSTRLVPEREIAVSVTGDLVGELVWRIRPLADGTAELSKDWRCNTGALLLRALTPVLRPLFRWNHRKCMSLIIGGLTRHLRASRAPRPEARPTAQQKLAAPARRPRAARPSA
jgi:hypothetical protein